MCLLTYLLSYLLTLLPILVVLQLFIFYLWAIGPTRLRLITWPCDLDLWSWRSRRLWLMRVVVLSTRIPSLKFIGLAIGRYGARCVSAWMGLVTPIFDAETGTRVASKVGNLPSKSGHVRPLGFQIMHNVRDGRTDGRKDKSNVYCLFSTGGGVRRYSVLNFYW